MHDTDWRREVEAEREGRNAFYLGPHTPLSPANRRKFKGLSWWPIDPRFRVEGVRLDRHAVPRPGNLGSTGAGGGVGLMEVGVLRFELLGERCALLAYEPAAGEADEPYVLVPFRDGTTGVETYGSGRYLDLEPGDVHVLDLNRAYHPYCAYDDGWACTLPPPENVLPFRVEAGERL